MIPQHERYAIRAGLIPTFPEFVDYVIAKYPRGDPHWLPQIPQNNFCNLSYQYILKMENLTDELSYLLNELELPKLDLTAIGMIEKYLEHFLTISTLFLVGTSNLKVPSKSHKFSLKIL